MKSICLFIGLFSSVLSFSQIIRQPFGSEEFESLKKSGVMYIKTGNEKKDERIEKALESEWKASEYRIYDPETDTSSFMTTQIVITEMTVEVISEKTYEHYHEPLLCLTMYGYLKYRKTYWKTFLGWMNLKGFTGQLEQTEGSGFYTMAIAGFNQLAETVINNKIESKGAQLHKEYEAAIVEKNGALLQDKTLLIIDDVKEKVWYKALDKYDIVYKDVTFQEYLDIRKEGDLSKYCLLCVNKESFFDSSIYDLATNKLVYSRHDVLGVQNMFYGQDIKKIIKHYKQN